MSRTEIRGYKLGIELPTICRQLKSEVNEKEMFESFPFWEQLRLFADENLINKVRYKLYHAFELTVKVFTGNARKELEKKLKKSVVSKNNYLLNSSTSQD